MCVCTFTDPADVLHVEEITSTAKFGCKMVVVDGGDSEEVPTLISGSEPSATDDQGVCRGVQGRSLPICAKAMKAVDDLPIYQFRCAIKEVEDQSSKKGAESRFSCEETAGRRLCRQLCSSFPFPRRPPLSLSFLSSLSLSSLSRSRSLT